ncbi:MULTISPECIES: ABC transporter ATP-binding protein [Brevibacillus]|uniref:Peptide ABC transporter ATP-binding protein n=1 Tax=Brevibacillus parabrevis TaxID=54914 RepID=A0A4Y3PGN2_BREPA|nr:MULTISPECIES: ABC transporter ATP-binding protein [Brevibacillus]NRQ55461.1 ABC transporter ATP-binding protein [Brevibacillus sp. HD1.4A]MBU8714931.1 ABC transporter ATP-binding protein [Brevibacillus parabrevis]MDH6352937.1 peptide/nickel transport system ATP-binding protein [Brevibacillus sp. 1238]MDR5000790.1 ABC transporter ATP-binding protein [Brevibacillus parabrevis]MED2253103.1 ABC transporter ATP-binding protein [Brevibacillus parabrevis]
MSDPVLQIENLQTHFFTDRGQIPAVDGVTITVNKGEVVGIVGESGCGKSVTSLSVMKLVPNPPGKIVGGTIKFKGEDLVTANEKRMRDIRGNEIAMIFQEPMTSLNPVFTIGNQIGEAIRLHTKASKKQSRDRAIDMLKKVGIPRAEAIVDEYPHQLSGGMRQRVMIAMAMACNPELLIADEPTTALDVTIQAQILDLMRQLNREAQTAILLITHDLGVVAEMCHRVVVMYAGNVIEEGDVRTILKKPKHPYTKGLLNSLPKLEESQERLYSIPGNVPIPGSLTVGCRFAPRCDQATDLCRSEMPQLKAVGDNHFSRCWLSE